MRMSTNPLFPDNPIRPEPADSAAVELIRAKVSRAYGEEPPAAEELAEVKRAKTPSKHQLFMQDLARSGKNLAEIQVAWHHYYSGLPDAEKREVWDEFYAANQHTPYQKLFQKQQPVASRSRIAAPEPAATPSHMPPAVEDHHLTTTASGITIGDHSAAPTSHTKPQHASHHRKRPAKKASELMRRTRVGRRIVDSEKTAKVLAIKNRIQHKVSAGGKLKAKHHMQSLLFGLGMGSVVLLILLFSFFNEYIITPFITPSANAKDIPVIITDITNAQAANPTVIVPKIGIQIPVDFTLQTTDEKTVENALNNGVVHYASTVLPGQNGNTALFGHSSQNIFNNGKYKFAFVRLRELTTGDIFYITNQGKAYGYQVFAREIVPPSQVSVLGDTKGELATAVLITCDPPGFSTNRLVVWGKQISPSPSQNTTATQPTVAEPQKITSNGPTLWTRMWRNIQFWR